MKNFLKAYKMMLSFEGKYSNDPLDRGGETYNGISRVNWPQWEGWVLIDFIKNKFKREVWEQTFQSNTGLQNYVQQFYYENYWLPLNLDSFDIEISKELFDTAVNQGIYAAGTYLQKALNKLNRDQKDYPDLKVDGKIGPATKHAYSLYMNTQRFASRNSEKLVKWLLRWLNYYQLRKYDLLTKNNPEQERFIPGWTERT